LEVDVDRVDVIVIGSGQGGVPFATAMARQGREVVMFERGAWGGCCVNYGCTPSKAFLASAHAAAEARRATDLGVRARVEVDFGAVMQRVRDMVGAWTAGVQSRLRDAGVRMVHAEARFTGRRTVSGGGVSVEAPLVVINTGASPMVPPIDGLEATPYITYETFWQLRGLPHRLAVVGAGYTGLELGQGMARLGSEVHLIDTNDRPIHDEEIDVSRALGEALYADGVIFHLSDRVEAVRYRDGAIDVTLQRGERLQAQRLLLTAGRRPNTAALDAGASDVELDERGFVRVDDAFRTTCDGVYAIGDVTGQPAFTHVSYEDYRRLMAILEGGERQRRDRTLSYAYFTEPQVGRVGLTLEQARAQGRRARQVTRPLERVARATETGRTLGFYRLVVDEENDRILGATLVSPTAAELIHILTVLIESGATWQSLAECVFIHPTWAEGLTSLARQLEREREPA